MRRRLAIEWLVLVACAVPSSVIYMWLEGPGFDIDKFVGVAVITPVVYAALGLVRLTVAAMATVFGPTTTE